MPKILVHTPFKLLLDVSSNHVEFQKGVHDVDDEIATHWYVKQHSEPVVAEKAKRAAKAPTTEEPKVEAPNPAAPPVVVDPEASAEGPKQETAKPDAGTGPKKPTPPPPMSDADKAERVELRAKITAANGKLPHHATGLAAHRAALEAATAS